MDKNQETKVWQRVAAPLPLGQSQQELKILLQGAAERASLYQNLMGQLPRNREQGKLLRELENANLACLKGMLVFSGHAVPAPLRTSSPGPLRQNLVRGYYLAKKAAAEYTARSVDPEFGVVYQEMASREIKICCLLTQLLGES